MTQAVRTQAREVLEEVAASLNAGVEPEVLTKEFLTAALAGSHEAAAQSMVAFLMEGAAILREWRDGA